MRSTVDHVFARAVAPLAFLDAFGILEAIVIAIVVGTGAFLCLVAYDLNTGFRRFDKIDARRAAAAAKRGQKVPTDRPARRPAPAEKAVR